MELTQLAEMATKVIKLSDTLCTTFDNSATTELTINQQEHLKLAIMAGLRDAYNKGDIEGYNRAHTEVKRVDNYAPAITPSNTKRELFVNCYTLEGTYLTTYKSIKDASKATGDSELVISASCAGHHDTGAKFKWSYTPNHTTNIGDKPNTQS